MATNFLGLATTSGNLVARCLLEKKVNFVPCRVELGRITPLIPINQKIMKYFVYLMHGSILLVTMPPPALPAHTLGYLPFFSFLEVYSPPPGTQKETIPHPRALHRPYIRFFATSFLPVQKQNDTFSQFINIFLSLLRGV